VLGFQSLILVPTILMNGNRDTTPTVENTATHFFTGSYIGLGSASLDAILPIQVKSHIDGVA